MSKVCAYWNYPEQFLASCQGLIRIHDRPLAWMWDFLRDFKQPASRAESKGQALRAASKQTLLPARRLAGEDAVDLLQ